MEEALIKAVRAKALEQGAPNSKLGIAKHIAGRLDISISERTFTNYLSYLEEGKELAISREIRESLAHYIEFKDYNTFKKHLQKNTTTERKYVFVIFVLVAVLIATTVFFNRKKCMIWEGDHFVKINCEEENAKPIDQRLLTNFRKVQPECHADFFFHEDGSPKVWYYKNGAKDLELFSMPGVHPIHGKTLNSMTEYMVSMHICEGLFE